jgi:probable HAF family extracellular repeat protein
MFVATSVHGTMGKGAARRWRALWLVWAVVAWAAQPSLAQRLIWLGTLPGGSESAATGVSADGSVVVGWAQDTAGKARAFRWTAAGGMEDLGTLGGDESGASEVSADGSVVVGWADNAAGHWRAFRWTASGGMQDLGTLGGDESGASEVSADGSVVVGWADNAAGQTRAFRWTAARGMQDLGTLGGSGSLATAVSADGSVVVGRALNAAGYRRAFRWTEASGMQDLGTLPGGYGSAAWGVSADGSVVVGYARDSAWQPRAFRWTAASGMEDLNITYAHLLTDGSVLLEARAISPDGRYIVGYGYNAATGRTEAFLLDTQGTGVEEGSGAARVRLRLLPQPAHERVVLELEVAEAAQGVRLMVSDVLGRVVAEPLRGAVLPPGVHRVELDVRAWAAGQYTVVLRTEAGSTAVPLVVVH